LSRRLPPSCRPQLPRWRSHQLNRALTRVNLSPDRPTHVPANAEDSTLNKSRLSKQSNQPKLNRKIQLFISIYFITQITTVSFTGWRWQRYPFRSKRDAVLNLMRNQKSLHHRKCLKLKRTPVATAKSGLSSLQSLRQLQPIPSALLLWLRLLHLLELQPHRYRVTLWVHRVLDLFIGPNLSASRTYFLPMLLHLLIEARLINYCQTIFQ
jgi:hypothetical protein